MKDSKTNTEGKRWLNTCRDAVSQATCEDHVKWITNEKSRKDRSVSKGETMSLERCIDLKMRLRSEIAGTGVRKATEVYRT